MGLFDSLNPIQIALDKVREHLINPQISKYGSVEKISYNDKRLYLTLKLLGLEDKPFEVSCGKIEIAGDCSSVRFGDFKANMPFLQNALDEYGSKSIPVPNNALAKGGLKALKMVVG